MADLPVRKAPPAPVVVAATDWTGCSVGLMGGLDIARLSTTETNYTQSLVPQSPAARSYSSGTLSRSYAGLDLGGRIGCQWQLGRIVLGPDLEIGKLGIKQNANVPMFMQQSTAVYLTSAIPAVRVSTSGGFYTAAPLKAGLAVNDRLLVYVKGGAAYIDLRTRATDMLTGVQFSSSNSGIAPAVGAGVDLTSSTGNARHCYRKHMVSFGLNYYFNMSGAAPVVAKY